MDFNIDEKKAGVISALPSFVPTIVAYCDRMVDGKLVRTRTLASEINRSYSTLKGVGAIHVLAAYRFRVTRGSELPYGTLVWGNKKTIAEFGKLYG